MTFQRYESRPITRLAHRITETDKLQALPDNTYAIGEGADTVFFKAHEVPQTGDYVVYLNDEDVYHCTHAVFIERNIVSTEEEEPVV